MQFLRIGPAGMRGKVGSGLNPRFAINLASAFATYIGGGRVLVGRDSRTSSPMLHSASVSALMACGCEVLDAGICPAPVLQFLVSYFGAAGGLLIGAGHHPADWNAVVVLADNGAYLNSLQTQELLDVYHNGRYSYTKWDGIGKIRQLSSEVFEPYFDKICSLVDCDMIASRKFKIVADFCNGSGSTSFANLARRLGVETIPINDALSGVLPHDPEPRPRSSVQVQSMIRYLKADAGFVFNSDMSRMAVVTDSAETLSEEYTFPLVADHVLRKNPPPCTVVTNWCTTRTLDEVVRRHGGTVVKTKVGQAFTLDRMISLDAKLGGDGSGSVVMAGAVPGYDSYLAMIMILESMAARKAGSAALASALPRYHIIKQKVQCPSSHAYTLLRSLKGHYAGAAINEDDGLRFDWPDGWIHLRAALTEPIIRMIVEWRTKEEAEEKAGEVRVLIERIVS